jgi:hypothetical protein
MISGSAIRERKELVPRHRYAVCSPVDGSSVKGVQHGDGHTGESQIRTYSVGMASLEANNYMRLMRGEARTIPPEQAICRGLGS